MPHVLPEHLDGFDSRPDRRTDNPVSLPKAVRVWLKMAKIADMQNRLRHAAAGLRQDGEGYAARLAARLEPFKGALAQKIAADADLPVDTGPVASDLAGRLAARIAPLKANLAQKIAGDADLPVEAGAAA